MTYLRLSSGVLIAISIAGRCYSYEPTISAEGVLRAGEDVVELADPSILVKFADDRAAERTASPEAIEQSAESLESATDVDLRGVRVMSGNVLVVEIADMDALTVESGQSSAEIAAEVAARIAELPEVEYAEAERLLQPQQVVDDPGYAQQWHLTAPGIGIDVEGGWTNAVGTGVVVSVIDTGILAHEDLNGQVIPGFDFITNTFIANDGDGRDADASDPGDWRTAGQCGPSTGARNSSWHGTHVAGTVAAVTNNATGVAGIARASRLLPVRVLGRCGGSTIDIYDAIRWSAGLPVPGVPANAEPAQVLNLSLGGPGACSAGFQDAIDDAVTAGATVVVAAGNSDADAANFAPASCDNVISVAATSRSGARAFFGGPGRGSNFGAVVDIAAPGGETFSDVTNGVLSTLNTGLTVPAADAYAFYQGTSMAAPHVAGVAALVYQTDPTITPAEVLTRLMATAQPFPTVASRQCTTASCGAGIVDAGAATDAPSPPGLTPAVSMAWMRLLLKD